MTESYLYAQLDGAWQRIGFIVMMQPFAEPRYTAPYRRDFDRVDFTLESKSFESMRLMREGMVIDACDWIAVIAREPRPERGFEVYRMHGQPAKVIFSPMEDKKVIRVETTLQLTEAMTVSLEEVDPCCS